MRKRNRRLRAFEVGTPIGYRGLHVGQHGLGRHMLPEAQDRPAGVSQDRGRLTVPLAVRLDFVGPVLRVRSCNCVMLRTSVPKAPVDKNRDMQPRKNDVCSSAQRRNGPPVHVVAKSVSVKQSTYGELGIRVPTAVRPHARSHPSRRSPRLILIDHMFDSPRRVAGVPSESCLA